VEDRLVKVHCFYSSRFLITIHRDDCPALADCASAAARTTGWPPGRPSCSTESSTVWSAAHSPFLARTSTFRDVYDHLIRISDLIDSYRDLLSSAMDVYMSTVVGMSIATRRPALSETRAPTRASNSRHLTTVGRRPRPQAAVLRHVCLRYLSPGEDSRWLPRLWAASRAGHVGRLLGRPVHLVE
jgi:hypothetical protein